MIKMEYHYNFNFPALTFTSPGIYTYTVKELSPSDDEWKTDDRVYRVVVTVTVTGDGTLAASVEYPDGKPRFINKYKCDCYPPPKPPSNVCKYFDCLPFPMFCFRAPQKPEFTDIMKESPNIFEWWENLLKHLCDD